MNEAKSEKNSASTNKQIELFPLSHLEQMLGISTQIWKI